MYHPRLRDVHWKAWTFTSRSVSVSTLLPSERAELRLTLWGSSVGGDLGGSGVLSLLPTGVFGGGGGHSIERDIVDGVENGMER